MLIIFKRIWKIVYMVERKIFCTIPSVSLCSSCIFIHININRCVLLKTSDSKFLERLMFLSHYSQIVYLSIFLFFFSLFLEKNFEIAFSSTKITEKKDILAFFLQFSYFASSYLWYFHVTFAVQNSKYPSGSATYLYALCLFFEHKANPLNAY